jgi:solute carrier family 35 protein F5
VTNAPTHSSSPVETPSLTVHLLGDTLALLGAFFYGCYTVLLKCQMYNETRADNTLFFGLVGLFNMFGMWPFLLLLHFIGWETFSLPNSNVIWIILCINALLGTFVSDYLWLIAVLLVSEQFL